MAKATTKVKITNATKADKAEVARARAANKADAAKPKVQEPKPGSEAPDAKPTPAAKTKAAEKLFKDADDAAGSGLPHDITVEQYENRQRLGALGY